MSQCPYCGMIDMEPCATCPKPDPKTRNYEVRLINGEVDLVKDVTYAFDNGLSGLVFRGGVAPGTYIIAQYAHGLWASFKEYK